MIYELHITVNITNSGVYLHCYVISKSYAYMDMYSWCTITLTNECHKTTRSLQL